MKSCPVEYWIWLQNSLGAGARTDEILAYFETPEMLYNAGSKEWRLSGLFTPKRIEALKSATPSETWNVLSECRRKGYDIITPDNEFFPKRLEKLSNMPLVLYSVGDKTVLNDVMSIGVVGTRNASLYGIRIAQTLSRTLADAGMTVVSGGALGVDSEAHAGAMLAKGRTLAFLGCGLSFDYLRENAFLRRAITRYGAVVSEYSPFTPAGRRTFPIRNRLISGVSLGVVVIEAGVKSGSLITANCAVEQGRDVFAVPGDIVRSSFDGTNYLIKNGAKPVFCAADILEEYEEQYGSYIDASKIKKALSEVEYVEYRRKKNHPESRKELEPRKTEKVPESEKTDMGNGSKTDSAVKKDLPQDISEEAKCVYSVLDKSGMHIDDIVRKTKLKMNTVLASLTELELLGFAEPLNGKKYKII